MRTALALAVAALLASPSIAEARRDGDRPRSAPGHSRGNDRGSDGGRGGWRAPAPPSAPAPARGGGWYSPAPSSAAPSRGWAPAPSSYATASAPAPYRAYAPAPSRTYAPAPYQTYAPLWWWGLGWGRGYYPLFLRPSVEQMPNGEPNRLATTLTGGVALTPDAVATGLALAIEGPTAGFEAGIDAISFRSADGDVALGSPSAVGWGTMHVTWTLLSEDAFRLRLETGGSMISMPAGGTSADMPWAGKVRLGPDVGISGQLGLVGPIGIEGHARVTPIPVPVTDTRVAVALRGGSVAVTAGWRAIRVMGDGVEAPSLTFSGPELGLAMMF